MSARTRDVRSVLRPVGAVVIGLGVAIALCALVGWLFEFAAPGTKTGGVGALLWSALIVTLPGIGLFAYGKQFSADRMKRRDAVLAVAMIWIAAGICGAIPFIAGAGMSASDAFFESISGLTTTGATVIGDIEGTLSRPLLLWRSLIQWLGGMGIVVLFVAVFPNVGAGGKHLFRGEVPGTTAEGLKPRIAETSFTLWKLYTAFTALELFLLKAVGGLELFDALCHSFTTMSTGGFSTLDNSIGGFQKPVVEYIIACFMLVGSVNYGLYYAAMRGSDWRAIFRSIEFRAFIGIVATAIFLLTAFNMNVHADPLDSFRYAFFMVATTISSTGYATDNYAAYSSSALTIMILLMFIGGCSGSTAGGIKVERMVLMGKQAVAQVRRSFRPAAVHLVRMGRAVIDKNVLSDVTSFFVIYMGCMAFGLFFVTLVDNVPLPTAFGAMLSCLSNMGPAPFHIGIDNFAQYSIISKFFFCIAMLLGRLEFFTLFALVIPGFWRR